MAFRVSELGIVSGVVVAAVLLTAAFREPGSEPQPIASSKTALGVAEDLRQKAEELDYDDPRLAATPDFVAPHASLHRRAADSVPDEVVKAYERSWRIIDHEPARFMKTIEIRVRWPREGDSGELFLTTVKVS